LQLSSTASSAPCPSAYFAEMVTEAQRGKAWEKAVRKNMWEAPIPTIYWHR
jgi:hypothetical protein